MAPYQRDSSQPYNQTLVEDLHDRLSRLGAPPAKAGLVWKPSSRSRRTKAAFAAMQSSPFDYALSGLALYEGR